MKRQKSFEAFTFHPTPISSKFFGQDKQQAYWQAACRLFLFRHRIFNNVIMTHESLLVTQSGGQSSRHRARWVLENNTLLQRISQTEIQMIK